MQGGLVVPDHANVHGLAVLRKWEPAEHALFVKEHRRQLAISSSDDPVVAMERALEFLARRGVRPYEELQAYNSLTRDNGARLAAAGITGLAAVTLFNAANARIGIGDSTTANPSPNTFTDLQAATNKLRLGMDATFPTLGASGGANSAKITFQTTFGNGQAEYAWQEVAVFNAAAAGDMLNRIVQAFGTKVANVNWQMTVTVTFS